jgi:ribosome-associated protein
MEQRETPTASAALVVDARVFIPASALTVTAVRASGPGGQNVNKVASKVDVRVDLAAVVGLDEPARARLHAKVGSRLDAEGRLRVTSQKTRDQGRNLEDAFEKIRALVREALKAPKPRRPTKPSRGAVERRLEEKKRAGERKRGRKRGNEE